MSVLAVGWIPGAPLLIPDLAGDDTSRDEELRGQVQAVVADVIEAVDSHPGARLVVVGLADEASTYAGTWDFAPLGLPIRGPGAGRLPTALGIAAWFLDDAGFAGPRDYVGISDRTPTAACAALGRSLAADSDIALLVVGDGSARRDEKAPGWLDSRASGFDEAAGRAFADGDPQAVLALDAELARELMAAGRAPWQVAAGATIAAPWQSSLLIESAPYGVGYIVARWLPHLDSNQEPAG